MKIHPRAKLTPLLRNEIHYSKERIGELAKKCNVTENTIRKWKRRTDFEDRSSRRKKICFTLNEFEEALICEVKKLTLFSIYDLLNILKPYTPQLNKDNLYRCLKRNGLNRNDLIAPKEDKKEKYGKFKN